MKHLESLNEFALISALTKPLKKHPDQLNKTHQSDAELLKQPDGSYLAATVDTLLEEYHLGLIRDPFVVGWSTVAHSLSDLAAVAADPLGVLLSVTFPKQVDQNWSLRFFEGAQAALDRHQTYCLGGDTSFGAEASFTSTALGRIQGHQPLLRTGAKAGDAFYVTGLLGSGNLLAIASQVDRNAWKALEAEYRPVARLAEVKALRPFMRCAIDTSDALLQALAILAALNNIGIDFHHREDLYEPKLIALAKKIQFPLWLVNVFGLGEHEVLFSVAKDREADFRKHAMDANVRIFRIGDATENLGLRLHIDGRAYVLDAPHLLNLLSSCPSIGEYLKALVSYDATLRGSK
ncbi:MAG: thiamine-phosphate kinase [Candidatus Ozemobacteraceae bacterium]